MTSTLTNKQYHEFVYELLEKPGKKWKLDSFGVRNTVYPNIDTKVEGKSAQYSTNLRNGRLKGHKLELISEWSEQTYCPDHDRPIYLGNSKIESPFYMLIFKKGRKIVYETRSRGYCREPLDGRLKDLWKKVEESVK